MIELADVHKEYTIESQRVEALRGVTTKIPQGSACAVTGKSGAGKSTLLHIVGMLDRPTKGSVRINGNDVSTLTDAASSQMRNALVGFVFQMNNLLPEFSALENVMMPGLIAGATKARVRDRAASLLDAVGLGERTKHRPSELSGGEQQRVAIARALVMAPAVILADEPTGNLDIKTSHAIQDLLLSISARDKVTLILVTHDLTLAQRLPTQIIMEDGRIVGGNLPS